MALSNKLAPVCITPQGSIKETLERFEISSNFNISSGNLLYII